MNYKEIAKKFSTQPSFTRGQGLFETDAVDFIAIEPDDISELIFARVFGDSGDMYEVSMELVDGQLIGSECTCPYDWEGICKHQVAALFASEAKVHNDDDFEDEEPRFESIPPNKRSTGQPFEISIADLDLNTFEHTELYHEAKNINQYGGIPYSGKNRLLIRVFDGSWNGGVHEVGFQLSDDCLTLLISSDSGQIADSLSKYELGALIIFKQEKLVDKLLANTKKGQKMLLLKEGEKYGLNSLAKAKKYLMIDKKSNSGQSVIFKPGLELVPIDSGIVNSKVALGFDESRFEARFLAQSNKTKEDRQLFFCLSMTTHKNSLSLLHFIPLVARKKRDGDLYSSDIQTYYDLPEHRRLELSEQDASMVEDCKMLNPDYFFNQLTNSLKKLEKDIDKSRLLFERNLEIISRQWIRLTETTEHVYWWNKPLYTYRIQKDDLHSLTLSKAQPQITLELSTDDDIIKLEPVVHIDDKTYKKESENIQWLHPLCFKIDLTLYLLNSVDDVILLHFVFQNKHAYIGVVESFESFFNQIVSPLSKNFRVKIINLPENITQTMIPASEVSKRLYLKELDKFILFRPYLFYGENGFNILDKLHELSLQNGNIVQFEEDEVLENEFLHQVRQLHPKFEKSAVNSFFSLHIDDFVKNYWFLSMFEKMRDIGIDVYGFNDFKNFNYSPYTPNVQLNISSGVDWFDLEVIVTVGDTHISLKEVRKAVLSKDKYIKLGDGKLAILPDEWVKKLESYFRIGQIDKESIQVSKLRFNVLDELFADLDQEAIVNEILEKKKKLAEFQSINTVKLPKVNASLRGYQMEGFKWLHFLHEFGWGGILADDMGLGKTLQMITFLKSISKKGSKKNLIVVPTSLLFNWEKELDKFCPSLSYHIYHGTNREKDNIKWDSYNLIITTYGLLVSDIEILKKEDFGYVILDESQAIKNPLAKRFKAARVLKADNRIAMTGTPIENGTFDLYAQMSFVNPGFFVSSEQFKKSYAIPIDRNSDKVAAEELNKMIHPFILRRTKEMVAKELPSKTEDVIYCQMEKDQRRVYDAFRNKYRNEILGLIESDELDSSKLHVLQALTKLRQICNSPALLNEEENYGNESVKIKELIRHIQEKTGRHKMLVFSQFTSMLKLIGKELEKLDIPYTYLDGKTTKSNREKEVERFQTNDDVRVFLISLKAGGTGLNLTAADYVYIVDPWWNPAVENQAIDRCYRIGQDKKVIAYRMICKDTLEEKIMDYKTQKKDVADAIITADQNEMKQISNETILELLS